MVPFSTTLDNTKINKKNLKAVKKNIFQHSPHPNKVNIIAVTKTLSSKAWNIAMEQQLTTIGESKIQEAKDKSKQFNFRQQIELHLIGHLQRNKARKAINLFDIIQTVDSIKLLKRIDQISKQENKKQKIFLQVNTGEDPNKNGFTAQEVFIAAGEIEKMSNVVLKGIMTIPNQKISKKKLCDIYSKTRKIRDKIKQTIESECQYLSMGMSNDYEIAIKEGATHIRIGSALFGERPAY